MSWWWELLAFLLRAACGLVGLVGLYLLAFAGFLFDSGPSPWAYGGVAPLVLLIVLSAIAFRRIDAARPRTLWWAAAPTSLVLGPLAVLAIDASRPTPPDDVSTADAIGSAYLRHDGSDYGTRLGFCIERPEAFAELLVVSQNVEGEGCTEPVVFHHGVFHPHIDNVRRDVLR